MTSTITPQDEFTTDEMLQIAFNEATDADDLAWMSTADDHRVAYAVIENPNVTYSILRDLADKAQHSDTLYDGYNYAGVAEAAEEAIADRFADIDPENFG